MCERALCARERRQLSAVGLSCIVVVVVVAGASLLLESYRCLLLPGLLLLLCACVCVHV